MQKLAVFDIDGTIAVKGVVPQSIIEGFKHLHEIGYATTVSTGRGYMRARGVLGEYFEKLISPEALMLVEHGTKIVSRDGRTLLADCFKENELDHVVDFIRANRGIATLVWFNSLDPQKKLQVWCEDPGIVEEEAKKRPYADVSSSSFEGLREALGREPLSNVSVKLKDHVVVENLKLHFTRSEVDVIFQDNMMEFVRNVANKGNAVLRLEMEHGIGVEDMLIAGNAINDVDMLNLKARIRVLVGKQEEIAVISKYLHDPRELVTVESPEALGLYLQKLAA